MCKQVLICAGVSTYHGCILRQRIRPQSNGGSAWCEVVKLYLPIRYQQGVRCHEATQTGAELDGACELGSGTDKNVRARDGLNESAVRLADPDNIKAELLQVTN